MKRFGRFPIRSCFVLGVIALIQRSLRLSLSRRGSGNGLDLSGAERVEAVHDGDAGLDFCGLAVGSRDMIGSPKALRLFIRASIRLRT